MNEENHMGWKLVSGVRRDVINLLKLFANTNSVRFEDFCKVWKEINFSLIFKNRVSLIELLEFSEELLQIVKEYLFPVYEFHTRVAAIYTLYGLYFKQPILGAAKVRFTKTEWEEVITFIEKTKEAKHYDVAFTFIKLYASGAFSFTATIRPAGLERGFRKYSEKRSLLYNKVCDVELLYRPLISEKLVNSLVKLESLYCRKKSELLGKKNLVFIDGQFAQSLQEDLKTYELASQSQCNVKDKVSDSQEENPGTSVKDSSSKIKDNQPSSLLGSSKSKQSFRSSEKKDDDEVPMKMRKFNRKYLELLAKKKAEFYIQKLQLENNKEGSDEQTQCLSLGELDFTDSNSNSGNI